MCAQAGGPLATPDYRALFQALPGLALALTPELRIVAVTDAYLHATMTIRQEIIGREIFELFSDNPQAPPSDQTQPLETSLEWVRQTLQPDTMPVQRHDIRTSDGSFRERHWSVVNSPVIGEDGTLAYILHTVEDMTDLVAPAPADELQLAVPADSLSALGERPHARTVHRVHLDLREANAEVEALLEAAPDAMVVVHDDGRIWRVNRRTEVLLGYPREELVGQAVEMLVPDSVRGRHPQLRAAFNRDPHARPMGAVLDLRGRRRDGSEFPIDVALSPLRLGDQNLTIAAIRDVTERRALEEQLRIDAARFRAIFHESPVGMVIASLHPKEIGVTLDINAALCRILGYSREELIGVRSARDAVESSQIEDGFERLARGEADRDEFEQQYVTGENRQIWLHAIRSVVRGPDGTPQFAVTHVEDVTLRKQNEAVLAHAATHDPLTGLPNRTLLMERLRQQLGELARTAGTMTVFYIDLDRFKEVNDTFGHDAGDELLVAVSQRLLSAVRPADTAARMSGDEFVVICHGLPDGEAVRHFGERILAELQEIAVRTAGTVMRPQASVGVALTADPTIAPEELLRRADQALYSAKARGRGQLAIYSSP